MFIKRLLRKRRFWLFVILLFLFAIVFDTIGALIFFGKSVTSGRWDHGLLTVGTIYAAISAGKKYMPKYRKDMAKLSKLLWLVCAIWAFWEYGFFVGLYFIVTITILTRILRFLLSRIYKRVKK